MLFDEGQIDVWDSGRRMSRRRKVMLQGSPETHCHYCRDRVYPQAHAQRVGDMRIMATKDHVVAACMGGDVTVIACNYCNSIKGDTPYEVFVEFMKTNPPYELRRQSYREFCHAVMLAGLSTYMEQFRRPNVTGRFTKRDLRRGR